MIYSCLGFLLLGEIIRRVTQRSLAEFTQESIFLPIGMSHTTFSPLQHLSGIETSPTQYCRFRKQLLRGTVHDENAYRFDEEGGNAGVFSTAMDLYLYAQMIFNQGATNEGTVLSEDSVRIMAQNWNPSNLEPRGLGWDIRGTTGYYSCGSLFNQGSIGHTGFTGTSLWMDPPTETVIITLSNRVHLSREGTLPQMAKFRPRLHNFLIGSYSKYLV